MPLSRAGGLLQSRKENAVTDDTYAALQARATTVSKRGVGDQAQRCGPRLGGSQAAWRGLGVCRAGAARIVRRVTRRAGISKQVSPHTLRHAFITAALDAGVPLRDVQEAASHADPRTTMRYDRARTSLDRHATYIVATYIAGAAR
jgi:integrase